MIEASDLPLTRACDALGCSPATMYRQRRPKVLHCLVRNASKRRLPESLRASILEALHSERFCDQTPLHVYHTLLGEGIYLASPRSMQRILKAAGEQRERRAIRPPQSHAVPRLTAAQPNQVWSWDITKLPLKVRGRWLYLYVLIDLYSRYIVGWMIAETENAALAQRFVGTAAQHHQITEHSLTLHQDRGAPMTAGSFISLLTELKIDVSHSRPRVSNDNPYSEAHFKTMKTQPCYPKFFDDLNHARAWCGEFFDWYNDEHHHSGLNGHIPADVFYGRADSVTRTKQHALDRAFDAHPERFVSGPPRAKAPPKTASINPMPISIVSLPSQLANNEIRPIHRAHQATKSTSSYEAKLH
jgi:putative transposase